MKRGRTEKKGKTPWRRWGIFVYVGSELDFFLFGERVESKWGKSPGENFNIDFVSQKSGVSSQVECQSGFLESYTLWMRGGGVCEEGCFFGFWAESLYINKEICLSST